jgi:hypothetical protein
VNGDHSLEVTPYAAADAPWPSESAFDPTGSLDTPGSGGCELQSGAASTRPVGIVLDTVVARGSVDGTA